MWLRDSLPGHVPNARIMAYGYDAAVRPSQTLMHLHDFAQDLLDRLIMARSGGDGGSAKRPLLFICHSLGGLVVKQALVMAALSKSQYGSIAESASGIAFFGTPHRGSRTASPALILARIFNAASMAGNVRSDLIKTLETQSPFLDTLSRMSREILAGLSVVSFYEQKPHEVTGHLVRASRYLSPRRSHIHTQIL
jgi:ankyrin repeat domain-containing protein 50